MGLIPAAMDPGGSTPSESGTSISKMQSVSEKDDRELIPVLEAQGLDLRIERNPSDPECHSVEQVDLLSGMLNDQVETPVKDFPFKAFLRATIVLKKAFSSGFSFKQSFLVQCNLCN